MINHRKYQYSGQEQLLYNGGIGKHVANFIAYAESLTSYPTKLKSQRYFEAKMLYILIHSTCVCKHRQSVTTKIQCL